jgi:hypothetical protein
VSKYVDVSPSGGYEGLDERLRIGGGGMRRFCAVLMRPGSPQEGRGSVSNYLEERPEPLYEGARAVCRRKGAVMKRFGIVVVAAVAVGTLGAGRVAAEPSEACDRSGSPVRVLNVTVDSDHFAGGRSGYPFSDGWTTVCVDGVVRAGTYSWYDSFLGEGGSYTWVDGDSTNADPADGYISVSTTKNHPLIPVDGNPDVGCSNDGDSYYGADDCDPTDW